MGQKVNPNGFRVGIIKDWESTWFTEKDYAKYVIQDEKIRVYLHNELKESFVSKIKIERTQGNLIVKIITARPGIVLGQGGENITKLEQAIAKIETQQSKRLDSKNISTAVKEEVKGTIKIEVIEVENADLDAQVVAEMIARQLENRANFRITQKKAIRSVMQAGAKGIKTKISGRLGGVEMARSEGYTEGNVPLHTIRA
ncbi:MAG: small ribosomal subunit protein uS3, partial [Mycoplasmatales bacterium]